MTLIASSVTDVVTSAGGWLFDRRMAGWQVTVLVPDRVGERALQILGGTALDLDAGLAEIADDPERAATLAVAADIYAADERVRRFVSASDRGHAEVALWGDAGALGRERQRRYLPVERGGAGVQGAGSTCRGHSERPGGGDGSSVQHRRDRTRADGALNLEIALLRGDLRRGYQ